MFWFVFLCLWYVWKQYSVYRVCIPPAHVYSHNVFTVALGFAIEVFFFINEYCDFFQKIREFIPRVLKCRWFYIPNLSCKRGAGAVINRSCSVSSFVYARAASFLEFTITHGAVRRENIITCGASARNFPLHKHSHPSYDVLGRYVRLPSRRDSVVVVDIGQGQWRNQDYTKGRGCV